MTHKDTIIQTALTLARDKKRITLSDVKNAIKERISRQHISTVLSEMIKTDKLIKDGRGRYTSYTLPEYSELLRNQIHRKLLNKDLQEGEVLRDIVSGAYFLRELKENVDRIFTYAFLEMLNNAIEHSKSKYIDITVYKSGNNLIFIIEDLGVGVFKNVMAKKRLKSELEAMQEILKGKTTTMPDAHSGEGIFFTSRISDVFMLESYGLKLRVDNLIDDIFYESSDKSHKGTVVTFIISLDTNKSLGGIFIQYQSDPSEGGFDKTKIHVRLYTGDSIYISRSQARRIMDGLANKFKTIVLDFKKVSTIGQAFADEIFRVFKSKHPEIVIKTINMNEPVEFMMKRVADYKTKNK